MKEGRKEGRKEGKKEGKKEGRKEGKKDVEYLNEAKKYINTFVHEKYTEKKINYI